MNKRISLLLYELDSLTTDDLSELAASLIDSPFSDAMEFGFYNIDHHINYLSAIFIKKSPTYISEYDSEKEMFIRRTIYIYSNISFALDSEYNMLEVYGSQKDSSKLRGVLVSNYLKNKTIKQISFPVFKMISRLQLESSEFFVSKLRIDNFVYKEKAYGCFNISKIENDFLYEILKDYKNEISRVSLKIDLDEIRNIELTFTSSGQLSIKSKDYENVLIMLKSLI